MSNSPPSSTDSFQTQLRSLPSAQITAILKAATRERMATRLWNCPHTPTDRQTAFLGIDDLEVLYGGAAGGAKTDALLMAASMYFDRPGYSALILRRTFTQLTLPDAIMDRAKSWWSNLAHWSEGLKRFTFPSGATLTFGHVQHESDKYNYQGAQFHFVGFDELTQFSESIYNYLFSRVRKLAVENADDDIPLRVRSASNPGGEGHVWVKNRFISKEAADDMITGIYAESYRSGDCVFIPSKRHDNPHLDHESYAINLARLDPVTRAQLDQGNWNAHADGLIKAESLRYWKSNGDYYQLMNADGQIQLVVHPNECQRIAIADCAATSEEVARQKRGKQPSLSVVSIYDLHRKSGCLIWRDLQCGFWGFNELVDKAEKLFLQHNPDWIGIEKEKTGQAACEVLERKIRRVRFILHGNKDKLSRAAVSHNLVARGKVFFPVVAPIWSQQDWPSDCITELLSWDGDSETPYDRGDTLSYAAREFEGNGSGGTTILGPIMVGRR